MVGSVRYPVEWAKALEVVRDICEARDATEAERRAAELLEARMVEAGR